MVKIPSAQYHNLLFRNSLASGIRRSEGCRNGFAATFVIQELLMKHYYSTVNGIVLTHSDMLLIDNQRVVYARFERPNDNGFDFAEGELPFRSFSKTYGFSEDELFELADYLLRNSLLIWEYSHQGMDQNFEEPMLRKCPEHITSMLQELRSEASSIIGERLKSVILFGSYARGDYSSDSDVDVMLLIDIDKNELVQYRPRIYHLASELDDKYDLFVSIKLQDCATYYKWLSTVPYYMNIQREGIVING
jgi:predicted nucleotidyltransferase